MTSSYDVHEQYMNRLRQRREEQAAQEADRYHREQFEKGLNESRNRHFEMQRNAEYWGRYGHGYGGDSEWMLVLRGVLLLVLLLALAAAPYLWIAGCRVADIWLRYYWEETVALLVLAPVAAMLFRPQELPVEADKERTPRPQEKSRIALLLHIAVILAPLGLSVWTFFFAPPIEVAIEKMNTRFTWWYKEPHFLFNPRDFEGSGEAGVERLLQEISNPDAKLDLIVQGLRAVGPSGEKALHTVGVRRLLQEFSNPKADLECVGRSLKAIGAPPDMLRVEGVEVLKKRLREDETSHWDVASVCLMLGEPLLPVMREMAELKHPGRDAVWWALCNMEAGTPGIERFTPEIIVNSMYIGEDSIRHSRFFGVLMKHSETLKRSVQDFVPSSKIEVEGKRTTLRLFSVLPLKEGAAFNSLCAEVRQKIHWIEHGVNF